jgi:hypothetical protein
VKVPGLEGRFFGGVATQRQIGADEAGDGADNDGDPAVQTAVGEGLTNEDRFLNSANLCRWVINFNEVHMGKQARVVSCRVVMCVVSLCVSCVSLCVCVRVVCVVCRAV